MPWGKLGCGVLPEAIYFFTPLLFLAGVVITGYSYLGLRKE